MASLSPAFRIESKRIHHEHQVIDEDLLALEVALEHLVGHSELHTDLAAAEKVMQCGRRLATYLPAHCAREEALLLDTVSDISPQLAEFAQEMKRQHGELLMRLDSFILSLGRLETQEDAEAAVLELKDEGMKLAREMRQHVAMEERELSGFL
jgi:hypothetical protein